MDIRFHYLFFKYKFQLYYARLTIWLRFQFNYISPKSTLHLNLICWKTSTVRNLVTWIIKQAFVSWVGNIVMELSYGALISLFVLPVVVMTLAIPKTLHDQQVNNEKDYLRRRAYQKDYETSSGNSWADADIRGKMFIFISTIIIVLTGNIWYTIAYMVYLLSRSWKLLTCLGQHIVCNLCQRKHGSMPNGSAYSLQYVHRNCVVSNHLLLYVTQ